MGMLPDDIEVDRAFDYENLFMWSSHPSRIGKILTHYELFKRVMTVPGDIIEGGVHKGGSLIRWATFRSLHGGSHSRRIVAFDAFDVFPISDFAPDRAFVDHFVESAGHPLSAKQITDVLNAKGLGENVVLVAGDINDTAASWVAEHPDTRVAFLHLDVDVYGASRALLDAFFPLLSPGGLVVLDDYGKFPGEGAAWDEFSGERGLRLVKSPLLAHVCVYEKT